MTSTPPPESPKISLRPTDFDITLPIDYDKIDVPPLLQGSEAQKEAFLEMVKMIKQHEEKTPFTPYQKYFIFYADADHHCLVRYLRARDFDVQKSFKLLLHTLEWIEEYKPHKICATKVQNEGSSGKTFCHGVDKFGRPVVYLVPRKENTYDNVANIELLVYVLWSAVDRMKDGHTQMTWICDFAGYSMKNAPSLSVCKQSVDILSSHFPERLGVALIVNPPRVFSWFWKLISPFIPAATKEKIKFCHSSDKEEMKKFLEPYFTMDLLPKEFGGDSDFEYETETSWKQEKMLDNARLKSISGVLDVTELYAKIDE